MNNGRDTSSLKFPSVSTMTAWFVASDSAGRAALSRGTASFFAASAMPGDCLEADETVGIGEAEGETVENGLHRGRIPVLRLAREAGGKRVGAEPGSVPIRVFVKLASDAGDDFPAHGSGRRMSERVDEGRHDRDRPRFVGEPERGLAAALVEQGVYQVVLSPCTGASDRLTNRPGREGIGIIEGLVKLGRGRRITKPAEGDRGLAADGGIAIFEKLSEGAGGALIKAKSHRAGGLKANAGGSVVKHGDDRFSCFGGARGVERPESVEPAGLGFRAIQSLDEPRHGGMSCADQDSLRFHSHRVRRMIERLDPVCEIGPGRPSGGCNRVLRGVTQPEETPGSGAVSRKAVERPIDDPEAHAVGRGRQGERAEVGGVSPGDEYRAPGNGVGSANFADLESNDGLRPPITEEEVAAVLGGEPVFVVADALGPCPVFGRGHDRECAIGCAEERVRIAKVAGHDVMGEAGGPFAALVGRAVGEYLVGGGENDGAWVALAGRDDLEGGSVGPDPDHSASGELDGAAILAGGVRHSLMADGDVQEAVHAEANSRRDVVVEPIKPRSLRAQAGDQVDTLVGFAVAVAVSKRGKKRRVHDVERVVDPFEALHAPEFLGEDAGLAVLDCDHTINRLGRWAGHIHGIGPDKQRAVGRGCDRGWERHLAGVGRQFDFPAGRGRRQTHLWFLSALCRE